MKTLFAAMALGLSALAGSSLLALAGNIAVAPGARIDAKGDWRRHEIVRTYRDESGCRLSVVSYHRPGGGVEQRQIRDCGRD